MECRFLTFSSHLVSLLLLLLFAAVLAQVVHVTCQQSRVHSPGMCDLRPVALVPPAAHVDNVVHQRAIIECQQHLRLRHPD
jgi:hypothetical protein